MGQRRYRPPWVLKFGPWGVWACACSGRSILHFLPRCWPASGVGNCEMPSLPCRSETQSLPESGKEVVLFVFVVPVGGPMSEKAPWRRVGPPHSLSGDSGNRAGQPPTYLSSIFFFHPPSCGRTPQPWSCQPARTTQNIIPILFFWGILRGLKLNQRNVHHPHTPLTGTKCHCVGHGQNSNVSLGWTKLLPNLQRWRCQNLPRLAMHLHKFARSKPRTGDLLNFSLGTSRLERKQSAKFNYF